MPLNHERRDAPLNSPLHRSSAYLKGFWSRQRELSKSHDSLLTPSDRFSTLASSETNLPSQAPDEDNRTRVYGWAVNIERLLADPLGIDKFKEFLTKEFSEENIDFWIACEQFKSLPAGGGELQATAESIYKRFLGPDATSPVNVDSKARQQANENLSNPTTDMFELAQGQIFHLMRYDSYARFLKSDIYKNCLFNEPTPTSATQSQEDLAGGDTPVKDKREEKSRKSLLPWTKAVIVWKRMAGNKKEEKASRAKLPFSKAKRESVAAVYLTTPECDVSQLRRHSDSASYEHVALNVSTAYSRESLPADAEHFAFCRVMWLDGTSSLVKVADGVTLRSSLSQLFKKRAISVPVSLCEISPKGSDKGIDLDTEISTLTGEEVIVTRHVVFVVESSSKQVSLAVRAKETRTLKEVLADLSSKFGLNMQQSVAHLVNSNECISTNCSVLEYHGRKIIVESEEDFREWGQYNNSRSAKTKPDFDQCDDTVPASFKQFLHNLKSGDASILDQFDSNGVIDLNKTLKSKQSDASSSSSVSASGKESGMLKFRRDKKSKAKVVSQSKVPATGPTTKKRADEDESSDSED